MDKQIDKQLEVAQKLLDDFLSRTGVTDPGKNQESRYLWTDAFAVQACLALSHETKENDYKAYALLLIDLVHSVLGKHRKDDPRKGWISGLPAEEGTDHPTAGGLRIGKKLAERLNGEPYNKSLEWDRDGQYFHYLTRWFAALIQAYVETGNEKYARWSAELMEITGKFLNRDKGRLSMYWKMNTRLTRPMVGSMGAHDPLEGLSCIISAIDAYPQSRSVLEQIKSELHYICQDMSWFTSDALGIGILMINTARAAELSFRIKPLPASMRPEYLFADSIAGLEAFTRQVYKRREHADNRLAFRECGLTLGFRVLYGMREKFNRLDMDFSDLGRFLYLVEDIEDFWSRPSSQNNSTWLTHRDINSVTLAANLLARTYPEAFCGAQTQSI
jgi:hypothetical protein